MRYQLIQGVRPGWRSVVLGAVAPLALVLAACGGGGSDSGVASIDGASAQDDADSEASSDSEQELLDWVECMRGEGVDVPDPEVDADGNLTFGGGGGFAGGGGGGDDGAPEGFDREALADAMEVCGDIPQSAFGGEMPDQSEMQDTMLEFAQCMRDNGYDMPDPDFSGEGNPGSFFEDIDPDDPAFQEASASCEDILAGMRPDAGADGSSEEG